MAKMYRNITHTKHHQVLSVLMDIIWVNLGLANPLVSLFRMFQDKWDKFIMGQMAFLLSITTLKKKRSYYWVTGIPMTSNETATWTSTKTAAVLHLMGCAQCERFILLTFSMRSIVGCRSRPKSMNCQSMPSRLYSSCSKMNIVWLNSCWSFSFV